MSTPRDDGPLRFHGTPASVRALAAADEALGGRSVELELESGPEAGAAPVRVRAATAGAGAMWLVATLPGDTAPGRYAASVRTAGGRRPARVDVDPDPRVVLSPPTLMVRGAPGARVPVALTVANVGNVTLEVPRSGAFGVMQSRGVEDAIGRALRSSSEGLDRVAVLADALARRHGGLVVVTDVRGRGGLSPRTVREVEGTLRVPEDLRPGRSYTGTWPLAGLAYGVELRVENPPDRSVST